jgi:hypothetical protein
MVEELRLIQAIALNKFYEVSCNQNTEISNKIAETGGILNI